MKEHDGPATRSAPVQIVQTHSLPGNLLACREDDLHLNARDSGCECQVFQLVRWLHDRFLLMSAFHRHLCRVQTARLPTRRHEPSALVADRSYFYVASLQTARLANPRHEPSAPV